MRTALLPLALLFAVAPSLAAGVGAPVAASRAKDIYAAALEEKNARTPNLSTAAMEALAAGGKAIILDARPRLEWAVSHIPGALNVAPKPGTPMSVYVSDVKEVERLVADRKATIVLYCNGPFCGKSRRLAEELLGAGYADVRRYQLGAPVWRALGKVMVIEPEGVRYVRDGDRTAVFIDARDPEEFAAAPIEGTRNLAASRLPRERDSGEIKAAKDDGRLPMNDHNTRIVVFGRDGRQARAVAEAIAREAFHNVAYFEGTFAEFRELTGDKP